MSPDSLAPLSAAEIAGSVRSGSASAAEVAEVFLARAEAFGPPLNTWIALDREGALRAAREVDLALARGEEAGPLCGVPVGLKDLIDLAGWPTTAGSLIGCDRVAPDDAPIARRLRRAGAVVLGKLNLHEFAFGPTGLNPHYGDMKNPWDPERMTGGSSGGSANAVATLQVPLAIGSDTGGSIRIPASLCGTFGHKPTFGLVGKSGCAPLSWSLDTFGPLAMSAKDCALAMAVLAGHEPSDPHSAQTAPPDFLGALEALPLGGMRIGIPRNHYAGRVEPAVAGALEQLALGMERLGAEVINASLPELELAYEAGAVIMVAEAAAVHEKTMRERADEYDPRVIERIRPGCLVPATAYIQALRYRGQWAGRVMREVFSRVDALLTPATPVAAPPRSARTVAMNGTEVEIRSLLISLTRLWNFFGGPSIAFPMGFTPEGLPMGAQLMGAPFDDHRLVAAVHQLETEGIVQARVAPPGEGGA